MKKLFLVKNPDLFQGEKYLLTNKNYFEGWYFKNTNETEGISFIPGINIENKNKKAFIQIITNDSSHFVNYDINEFEYTYNPFCIKIEKNIFSKEKVEINIKDNDFEVYGKIKYSKSKNINTNLLNPNIMGPFSYIPSMECNHAILSMQNKINGTININNRNILFKNNNGYIEKDWGYSFPKSYIWCQGNNFQKTNASFMCSIADIPFKIFNFRGIICVLIIENKEYKFTTYNNTKLLKYNVTKNSLNILLRKGKLFLSIKSKYDAEHKLSAPEKGKMSKDIFESISSLIEVTLRNNDKIIFSDISRNCGLEIVLDIK